MALELRPEQQQVVDDISAAFRAGYKRVMVSAACGFGKTELATAILLAAKNNGKRGGFLADRISLCTQTSERFDKYGLDHGMMQASHWRFRPAELVQVCSVQTLARRQWPEMSLIVVDEAHVLNDVVKKKLTAKDCYAIGLSATAVTPGLGKYFDTVVNAPTTNRLIEMGRLVPLRYFACTSPDMDGVKVVAGEWEAKETDKRALQVVGDVVQEYLKNGQGKKFIGFAASIVHAQELQRQFIASGINVATYTANDQPEDRAEIVQEFKKEDSTIRGILSVEALTRGFDVASVEVLILARPLRSSLAVHIQMLGRVMRTCEGKSEAIVLDHSGNVARFWKACNELFENGVTELDDGKKKEKPKAKEEDKEKEMVKCPKCRAMHMPRPSCPSCFAAGTLVLTEHGWTPIEDVHIGTLVLTHKGRWRPVVDTLQRMGNVLELKGLGHPGLATTSDHQFLTRVGWENADRAQEWASPSFIERFPVPTAPFELTPPMCRLIGCFLGDGYTSIRSRSLQPEQEESILVITCGHTADETGRVCETIADAGFKFTLKKVRTGHIVTVYAAVFTRWLRAHFGVYCHGKTIPPWILGLPRESKEALLQGYLEADGCFNPQGEWCSSSVSKKLTFSIKLLAQSIGYGCRLYLEHGKECTIEGRTYMARDKWRLVGKMLTPSKGKQIVDLGMHHYAPIKKRTLRVEPEVVYDITVEEDHSYVVEGIVVHNCGHEYPRRAAIEHIPGTLKELVATGNPALMRKMLWPQVCSIVFEATQDIEKAQRRAQAIYHELTGTFAQARVENTTCEPPTPELRSRIKANQIRFIKGRQAQARKDAVAA